MKNKLALVVAALAISAVHAPASAAAQKAPAKPAARPAAAPAPNAPPSKEQQEHGLQTFSILTSALQSKNVPDDVKSVLMFCVYENSIGKISETVDKVIADNPGKIDRSKPDQMLSVIAQICGYEPPATPAGAAPSAPQGAPTPGAPAGR